MLSDLKKRYYLLLMPAIVALFTVYLFRYYHHGINISNPLISILTPIIFTLSVFCAVAWPILYRSYFSHNMRNFYQVTQEELCKFEQKLISIVMITPYLAVISYFLEIQRFYLSGIILLALYAVYYFYPSKNRITFDRKIFRVIEDRGF